MELGARISSSCLYLLCFLQEVFGQGHLALVPSQENKVIYKFFYISSLTIVDRRRKKKEKKKDIKRIRFYFDSIVKGMLLFCALIQSLEIKEKDTQRKVR